MTERTSFYRKITYLVAIAVLLIPLSLISSPAAVTEDGMEPGGKLAQLRDEYRLGQANLGEIDPASETMKLATLGLRGVAMNLLWEKANYYKKTEDWSNLTATLDQLSKLQPNFITFWKFQSWNISYNVSVEFDDYRDRYYYVRRGIEFLKKGENYNKNNPHLLWDLGWFIGQKIGRADEHVQYRRLFKADDDFHAEVDRSPDKRDNWLVGKEWYLQAINAVDNLGRSIGKKSPKVFYSSPVMSQINYAEAIEKEGSFGQARAAWSKAADEWKEFGDRDILHSTGVVLHLNDEPKLLLEVEQVTEQLDSMLPNVRETLAEEKEAALSPEEKEALNTPSAVRTAKQIELAYAAQDKMQVKHREVAERIASEKPADGNGAFKLAAELQDLEKKLRFTKNYKRDSNFDYWELRCAFEQTPEALRARQMMFLGKQAFEQEADLLKAQQRYDEGFAEWRRVLDTFPALLDDETTTGDDLMEYVKEYRLILDQLDETLDDNFPLWDVIENFDTDRLFVEELQAYKERQQAPEESELPEEAQEPPAETSSESDDSLSTETE